MRNYTQLFTLLCVFVISIVTVNATNTNPSTSGDDLLLPLCENPFILVQYDFDNCQSIVGESSFDYSEFTPFYMEDNLCSNFSGSNVYRSNPILNQHSCTEGVDGSIAMCVGSYPECEYSPGHGKTVKFEITVTPENDQISTLSGIQFFEKAPEEFSWIDGDTGLNNYPQMYGLRVLVNGGVVFQSIDIPTTTEWTLETFDFSDLAAFTVSETTEFAFELLPYCVVGNGAWVSAWDIDDLEILSCCAFCDVKGGLISTNDETTICTGDGNDDIVNVSIVNQVIDEETWVVTNELGDIVAINDNATFNFEGAESGTCYIYHISHDDTVEGIEIGSSVFSLGGCVSISNGLEIIRIGINGGLITTIDPINICSGDGIADLVSVNLTDNVGANSGWIITTLEGNIEALPLAPPFDFEGAITGTCLIYHISFEEGLSGYSVGLNVDDLLGCYHLSNPITVNRTKVDGGVISTLDPTEVCADNGVEDLINVDLMNVEGSNTAWVLTNNIGDIIGLPAGPPFDFDQAGSGICFIYHLAFEGAIEGLAIDLNINDITGCYDFSNRIMVTRNVVDGGQLTTMDPVNVCSGDGISDLIDVTLSNAMSSEIAWMITDDAGIIIDIPSGPPFDFEGAEAGECWIFAISYESLEGLTIGESSSFLQGCFALSNRIVVTRNAISPGLISTVSPTEICTGDGINDILDISQTGAEGLTENWIVTDESGNILSEGFFPPFDLEGLPGGTCLFYHVSINEIENLESGNNINDLTGCFALSNAITVLRNEVHGGLIETADFVNICVGDGLADVVNIQLTEEVGTFSTWVITDDTGNILEFDVAPPFDFEGAGTGVCIIRHLSYTDLSGLVVNENIDDLEGCFNFSNEITITRSEVAGGIITTQDPISICVGDGNEDIISATVSGNTGANNTWVVTDEALTILEFNTDGNFNFEGAPGGICLLWHLSFETGLEGAEVGLNAGDLQGCFALSNAITVTRNEVSSGSISTTDPTDICFGNGSNTIVTVNVSEAIGEGHTYLITDDTGTILNMSADGVIDFNGAGEGTCYISYVSYNGLLNGNEIGENIDDLEGCFSISTPIEIIRTNVDGGIIETNDPTTICLVDEDNTILFSVLNADGSNRAWTVTDESGILLNIQDSPEIDFSGAEPGVCYVRYIGFESGIVGLDLGENVANLTGCFDLSNSIAITRIDADGGMIVSSDNLELCVGDGLDDLINVNVSGDEGESSAWLITSMDGTILDMPLAPPFNFENAGGGICLIYHLSMTSTTSNVIIGSNINNIEGCYALSNALMVTRNSVNGGSITSNSPLTICVGDDIDDLINVDLENEEGSFSSWFITDASGNILEIPSGPPFNLENAGAGVCLIWHVSYEEGLAGLTVGGQATDLIGCYNLSNAITVNRFMDEGGNISLEDGTDAANVCVGDCLADLLTASVNGNFGANSSWIITDTDGDILTISETSTFDFEDTGFGVCVIYHISYEDGIVNFDIGRNIGTITGCYDFSNPIVITKLDVEGEGESRLFFNMENCEADIETSQDCSYEEFTATIDNSAGCATLEVFGGHLYRDNPTVNKHSCTEGVQQSTAMCVSSYNSCAYDPNTDYPVKIDVLVTPGLSGMANLSGIEFFEKAPEEFSWINGSSGPNNYPTKYAIRVLKDGVEIFRQDNNPTSFEWSQEAFDFSDNPDFTTTEQAVFSFELLGYCLIGAQGPATAWDLDDIVITSECSNKLNAGEVYSSEGVTELEVCVGDGAPDVLPFFTNSTANPYQWVITDENNIIIGLPGGTSADFENAPTGECRVWGVTYVGDFIAVIGDDITTASLSDACAMVSSNYITVNRVDMGPSCIGFGITQSNMIEYDVFPNPAENSIMLDIKELPSASIEIQVFNMLGNLMMKTQVSQQTVPYYNLDISTLEEGPYTVRLTSEGIYKTKKFVKVNK